METDLFRKLKVYGLVCCVLPCVHLSTVAGSRHSDAADPGFGNANRPVILEKPSVISSDDTKAIDISGRIVNLQNEPLIGVNITIKGAGQGTVTDIDGNFRLKDVSEDAVLVITYVGYKGKEMAVGSQTVFNITLEESFESLEEVVVVGYGTQKKSTLTGSVTDIKADRLVQTPTTNVKGLLIGQVPGLISNQNPGLPGNDNANLSIRGFGSPLVIVDGVESFLDRIDPNDIESVSVLKDASAAIYGARAGNGVILITTKRGAPGKTTVNYHGYVGFQKKLTLPQTVNAVDYIRLGRDAVFNAQYDPKKPEGEIAYGTLFTEENLAKFTDSGISYNWADAVLKNYGSPLMSHNLSISGGTDKVKYFTSIGKLDQEGIIKGDYSYDKWTVTNNLDIEIAKGLALGTGLGIIHEFQDYAFYSESSIFNDLHTAQPIHSPSLPDPERAPYSGFSERSPIARINQKFAGYQHSRKDLFTGSADLGYQLPFVNGLKIGYKLNVRLRKIDDESLNKKYQVWSYDQATVTDSFNGYTKYGDVGTNDFSRFVGFGGSVDPSQRWLSRAYATYTGHVSDHNFGVLVFGEKEDNIFRSTFASRRALLSSDIPQLGGSEYQTNIGGTGRNIEYTRVSFASRFNYDFANKYLFEVTLRSDASSKFGPKVRWGYFPSASVGWNIAQEGFMENSTIFDQLKLRLSYSRTGVDANVSNTAFDYLAGFEESLGAVYILDGVNVPIIRYSGLTNERITWEGTTLYNAGIDITMFNGKLFSTIEAFYRYRDGILRTPIAALPSTFGASLPGVNIDSRSNRGAEFSLGYQGRAGDFRFSATAGVAYARERFENYLENIDENDPVQVKYNKLSGRWVNMTFGYKSDGLFNTQAEVDEYLAKYTIEDISGRPKAGDIRYVDLNNDNKINREDQLQIGWGNDPQITYTFSPVISYKMFSLAMLWQGGTQFNVNISGSLRAGFNNEQVPLTLHARYTWRQDPANPGIGANPDTRLPAFDRNGTRLWNNQTSDFWMYNGAYLRLKTATLNMTMPQKVLDKVHASKINFYIAGDNLWSVNRMGIFKDVVDPEEASAPQAFKLPLLRTLTFGLQVGF